MAAVQKKLRCQCDPTCPLPPEAGSAFCKNHQGPCPRVSPLTEYEPSFTRDRELWNKHREGNNCFSYAMNILDTIRKKAFPQPGKAAGYSDKFPDEKSCDNMIARLFGDNGKNPIIDKATDKIKKISFEEKCPDKMSKIALIIDADEDYHFLRQDSSGWWSQKGGAQKVTNLDASDRPIWDPQLCDNNWLNKNGYLNYNVFCSYMCVSRVEPLYVQGGGSRRTRRARRTSAGLRRAARPSRKSRRRRTQRTKRS